MLTGKIVQSLKLRTPFKGGGGVPGKDWFRGFKARHPDVVLRKPEASSTQRMRAVNPVIVSDHFLKLEQVLINLNLKNIAPQKIWTCDETGFQFQHKATLVCARKGSKNVSGRTSVSRINKCVSVGKC